MGAGATQFLDNQIWSDYYIYKQAGEKSKFVHRIGSRVNLPASETNCFFHYRPSFRFSLGQIEPQLGTALFYVNKNGSEPMTELRPWFGIRYNKWIASFIKFVNLARLEYRLMNKPVFADGFSDATRLRYQFGLNGTLYSDGSYQKMYGLATAESFWNLSDLDRFDYNLLRLNTGVGFSLNESISMELIYTKNIEQSGTFSTRGEYSNLFQFKLRHRL